MVSQVEAELLSDGRIRLFLSPRKRMIVALSLGESLVKPERLEKDAAEQFRTRVGISMVEAWSLDDEMSIIHRRLLGLPENMSEEDRERYERVMPKEPRRTGTVWDDLPKMEAELLPDGRMSYTLARGELAIFANAISEMLRKLASDKSRSSRTEVWFRVGGIEIEEAEELRDELRRLDQELRDDAPRDLSGG